MPLRCDGPTRITLLVFVAASAEAVDLSHVGASLLWPATRDRGVPRRMGGPPRGSKALWKSLRASARTGFRVGALVWSGSGGLGFGVPSIEVDSWLGSAA